MDEIGDHVDALRGSAMEGGHTSSRFMISSLFSSRLTPYRLRGNPSKILFLRTCRKPFVSSRLPTLDKHDRFFEKAHLQNLDARLTVCQDGSVSTIPGDDALYLQTMPTDSTARSETNVSRKSQNSIVIPLLNFSVFHALCKRIKNSGPEPR